MASYEYPRPLRDDLVKMPPIQLDPAASPVQTFGELIARTADDLASLSFIAEWVGPGERVPTDERHAVR